MNTPKIIPRKRSYPKSCSVILLNYNGLDLLKKYFASVMNLEYPNYEVIVVDNASDDKSTQYLEKTYPGIHIVYNLDNYGTAYASNLGAQIALGDYLFFISNDMELDKDILRWLSLSVEMQGNTAISTCVMYKGNSKKIDNIGGDLDILGFPRHRKENDTDPFHVYGGAMFIKRNVFEELEGFDEETFTLADDIDLCWRARLLGYRITSSTLATLKHQGSATLGSFPRAKRRFLSERNTLRMLLKNYTNPTLCWILPIYFIVLFLEFCFFLIRRPPVALSIVRALVWNMYHLPLKSPRRRKDKDILKLMIKFPEKVKLFFDYALHSKADRWKHYFS